MREKIDEVIKNCITCILAEQKHGKQGFLRNIPKHAVSLETYYVDHLGPIPKKSTKKSYAHILVVVDAFTKFTWLYPMKSTSAEEVNRLTKQAVIFGNPRQIMSDRGTAFTSNLFQKYCIEDIEHILIATGVPRENGQVERINRIVILVLTKLYAPHPETWYKFVNCVQQYINSSMSRSTGLSPFELLIGKNMRLKDNLELKQIIENETIQLLQEKREALREQAKDAIEKVQRDQRIYNREKKRPNIYSIGDLIAIKRTQMAPGSKLCPKYLGPYQITHVLRGDRYVVSKVGEHKGPRSTTISIDNMKKWLSNEYDSNTDSLEEDKDDEEGHQRPMQNNRVVGPVTDRRS